MLSSESGQQILGSHQRRLAHRARRLAIFDAWNKNPHFNLVGQEFGLTRVRVRQIVWKAIVSDGCRSDQARAWMAQLDEDGYWLRRYELGFAKSGSGHVASRRLRTDTLHEGSAPVKADGASAKAQCCHENSSDWNID